MQNRQNGRSRRPAARSSSLAISAAEHAPKAVRAGRRALRFWSHITNPGVLDISITRRTRRELQRAQSYGPLYDFLRANTGYLSTSLTVTVRQRELSRTHAGGQRACMALVRVHSSTQERT